MSFNILCISIDLLSQTQRFSTINIYISTYVYRHGHKHTNSYTLTHTTGALYTCTLTSVILKVRPALREKVVPELRDWKVLCWTWGLLTGPNCPPRFPIIPWLARVIWEPCKEL